MHFRHIDNHPAREHRKQGEVLYSARALGTATDPSRPHEKIWIVGEVKFNLTVKDVERFAKKVSRARNHLTGELLPVCFCYRARPEVEEAATRNGIRMVYSYGRFV